MDQVCPPSTVYAAYHARMAAKRTSSFTRSMIMRVDSATNALSASRTPAESAGLRRDGLGSQQRLVGLIVDIKLADT
jgi:hypothetical protein